MTQLAERSAPKSPLRRLAAAGLRRRLAGLFAVAGLVLVGVVALGAVAFGHLLDTRQTLINDVDPASFQVDQLLLAYVNQETGVRGYVLSENAEFLQPYEAGLVEQRSAAGHLSTLLAGEPSLSKLVRRAEQQATEWQEDFARPAIAAVPRHDPKYASEQALLKSKSLFDAVRARFTTLDGALATSRAAAGTQLNTATQEIIAVLLAGLLLLLVGGIAAWLALRVWVTAPLLGLGSEARKVASGDLLHPIEPNGPPDLRHLAADIEAMRRRIVDEIETIAAARSELDARNVDLARSNVELEQFAYVASHDLQEPLRKVISFVQLLQQRYSGQLDERADQYIDFAVDGAKRMQGLINDLLKFSRVGRSVEGFDDVELTLCLESALANLSSVIEESGATVTFGSLPLVSGDAGLLTSMWQNLVANSVKFRGEDPPVVLIEVTSAETEWLFSVTDNGIGIEPRFSEKIFVIFQRLHGRDAYGGTGIGLALCKKIVEFHGGRIWLDTEQQPGARLCFTLPGSEGTSPS